VIATSSPLVVLADEEFDPNSVTPGVWGFVLTVLVMVVVVLLVLDMVRRIRRVNYRAEVREQLEAEQRESEIHELEDGYAGPDAAEPPVGRAPPSDETGPAASDDGAEPPAR